MLDDGSAEDVCLFQLNYNRIGTEIKTILEEESSAKAVSRFASTTRLLLLHVGIWRESGGWARERGREREREREREQQKNTK